MKRVREALRLLGGREAREQEKLEALRAEVQQGIDSSDAGRRMSKDAAMVELRARRAAE